MAYEIIDTPNDVRRYLPRLTSTETIIRYITSLSPGSEKHVKVPEIRAIKAAGKQMCLVHEVWGDFKHAGRGGISRADGVRDGRYARRLLPTLGVPTGGACYFAVDIDASAAQLKNNVLPYFEAVREAFADGEYRVGVYGPGTVCKAALDAGYVDLTWLSNAKGWSGYKAWEPKANLIQKLPVKIAGGLDVDPNVLGSQGDDWGQYDPFSDGVTVAATDEPAVRLGQSAGEDTGDPIDEPEVAPAAAAAAVAVKAAAASGATVGTAVAAGTAAAAEAGAGPSAGTLAAGAAAAAAQSGWFTPSGFKSMFKSKIAWLTGGLSGTGASVSVASDPETVSLLSRLVHAPAFWLALLCVILGGLVVYFRWKDYGKGTV